MLVVFGSTGKFGSSAVEYIKQKQMLKQRSPANFDYIYFNKPNFKG